MKNIFISIIVPVYNVERYLRECLDSIVRLEEFSWEAILIDDGSTDSSGAICDEYAEKNHKFKVVHQSNRGVSVARTIGIELAQGDWVWFVDSDDIIIPNFIIDNIEVMNSSDYILFDFCTFRGNITSESARLLKHCSLSADSLNKNDFLLRYRCNHHQRIFYRRSLLGNKNIDGVLRFSPKIRVGEDLEFQYKYLTRCKRPVRLNAELYNYRLRDGSATQDGSYRQKNVDDLPQVLLNILQWCKMEYVQPVAWLEVRMQQMFQNLLYSASLVKDIDLKIFQSTIRILLTDFNNYGFTFPNNSKMRLAYWSVKTYFVINKAFLKAKGIKYN